MGKEGYINRYMNSFWAVCIFLPLFLTGYLVSTIPILIDTSSNFYRIVMILHLIVISSILILLYRKRQYKQFEIFKIKNFELKKYLYIVFLGIGLTISCYFIVDLVEKFFPSYYIPHETNLIQIILDVIFVPVYEEILFRCIIFGYLIKRFKLINAIFIQALIFSISHFNILQSSYTFVFGIVFGIICVYTNSVLSSITLHIILNLFGEVIIADIIEKFPNIQIGVILFGIIALVFSTIGLFLDMKKNRFFNNILLK